MTGTSAYSLAPALKGAMVTTIKSLVDPAEVLVTFGHPGPAMANWDDVISVADVTADQNVATMATNRAREEVLQLTVWVSVHRPGDSPDLEQTCSDRAFALLGLIEHQTRYVDTTLGGVVRQCFLTHLNVNGFTDAALLAEGRTVEIEATFTANGRVTGP